MTAETDLLPLVGTLRAMPEHVQGVVQSYARANVAHATAPLQAEIKALRAEVDALLNLARETLQRIAAIAPGNPTLNMSAKPGDKKAENEMLREALKDAEKAQSFPHPVFIRMPGDPAK